jgi:autoinducer 2-degrading protein
MITTLVHVWVKEAHIDDFIAASTANHRESVKESGNLRFDLLQDANDPAKFVLYEAYESPEAAAAHKETAHYQLWRDTVADWMARPRQGDRHLIIAPKDPSLW